MEKIKNAIQVFWSKPYGKKENNTFGFKTLRHFYMSAFYSLKCLKDHGYHVTLITDDYGKKILNTYFGLPYDEIDVSLNNLNFTPLLWPISKIYAYSLQKEPFIYCDLDAFLIKDIPSDLKDSDIFCQNIEIAYPGYFTSFDEFKKYLNYSDDVLELIYEKFKSNDGGLAYNTGIFGGNDITTIHKFSKKIFDFLNKNYLNDLACDDSKEIGIFSRFSIFYEQMYFYYYIEKYHPEINVKQLLPSNIFYDLTYYNQWRNDFNHLIFTLKSENGLMLESLERESIKSGFLTYEQKHMGWGYEQLLIITNIKY
jgi:hypothetical protein